MNSNKGYFLVLSTAVISGFSIFINQFGVKVFNPYIFTGLKNLTVAVLLTSLLFLLKDRSVIKEFGKKQWFLLAAIGLIGGSIPFLLFFKGLSLTTAANGSFLHKTMFLYAAVFAAIFLKEKIDKKFFLGGLFLLFGNFLLLKTLSLSLNYGDLMILAAALFWAAENTVSKYALGNLSGRVVAWGRMFFGTLFIFCFLLLTGQASLIFSISLKQIAWVAATSAFLFGYVMTWYSGLKYVPVSQATAILLIGSPITTLLSFLQTGRINSSEILAGAFIVLGLILIIGFKETLRLANGFRGPVQNAV